MRITIVIMIIGLNGIAFGQDNLVPNFSFEMKHGCPPNGNQVDSCMSWSKYSDAPSSPDYYNSCASSSTVGVPQSFFMYQPDQRNCGAYMGLVNWTNNANEREHIGIQLNQPLVIGQKYFLSFSTVMGGTGDGSQYYESPSNNIGMRLSTVSYSESNPAPIDNFSHLRSVAIVDDTMNWIQVSGSIIADSAYEYLILGNFYDDANTDTTTLNCGICINNYSYSLIDDVCISTDSLFCNSDLLSLPCNLSINENQAVTSVIYPNPTQGVFWLETNANSAIGTVRIYNPLGQLIIEENNIQDKKEYDLSTYEGGLYYIEVQIDKEKYYHKILKQ